MLGGRLTTNIADFASVEVAGVHFGMAEISVSLPRPDAEYPHYALFVEPEELLRLRERLVDYGIPVGPIWTRRETEALMFFKDPSGNLFELLCRGGEFPGISDLPHAGTRAGGALLNLASLNYEAWKGWPL